MLKETLIILSLLTLFSFQVDGQSQGTCKEPYVEQRLLADDVRYASPFYVIALPRNARTETMDNVCYTYYENDKGGFFHIMSITFKNGSNTFYQYSKGDILDRMGVAEATALSDSNCTYHDYTLKPICNVSVFILYRCFIQGQCGNIDIGVVPGVDVRVTLAASPQISPECRAETENSLKDTSALAGGDYVILPQNLKPQCVTKYDNLLSIGHEKALGTKEVSNDLIDRFADDAIQNSSAKPATSQTTQGAWNNQNVYQRPLQQTADRNSFNPYGVQVKPQNGYPGASSSRPQTKTPVNGYRTQASSSTNGYSAGYGTQTRPPIGYSTSQTTVVGGHTPAPVWPPNNGQWNPHQTQWNGQNVQPGADTHYHIWQSAATASVMKSMTGKNSNIYYHIHSWDSPPPGCCKCN